MLTNIGTLQLKNPVLTASGTFGYGLEYQNYFDISCLGGICTKGLSLFPKKGNPPPRICEAPSGMLNAIGLENIGVDEFCKDKLPKLNNIKATIIVNAYATSINDFVEIAKKLNSYDIAAIEINISCPNVDKGGLAFGIDANAAAEITSAVKVVSKHPIWIKLSPEAGDITKIALACQEAGADALCAINTIRGLAIDINTRKFKLANKTGGLSGAAIKPIALRMVWEIAKVVKIPIIGIGGICNADDAIEFILAGASAIQVGSISFQNPVAAKCIVDGIRNYCKKNNTHIKDLIGKAA